MLLSQLVEIFNVHDLIISQLLSLLGLLHILVVGAGLGLDPGLAHVQLLPAGGGLHHSRVHTQLVPGPQDGHPHVAVGGPAQLCHRLAKLGVGPAGEDDLVPVPDTTTTTTTTIAATQPIYTPPPPVHLHQLA